MAASTFVRWSRLGVCELAIELGMPFIDGASIRAYQKAAGATKQAPLRRNAVLVRRLAALAAAMAPRPA
jgi:hypothetical protein